MHQVHMPIQVCFRFDAQCKTDIRSCINVFKMLLIYFSDAFYSAIFISCYVCYASIFLLTSMITFHRCPWDIKSLTTEISPHKYSPYIWSSMLKIVHISNINQIDFTILRSVLTKRKYSFISSSAFKCNNQFRVYEA